MNDEKETEKKIEELLLSTKRENIDKLISWLKSTDFFVAPASSKYHLNVKGGLAYHSLKTYETFDKLASLFQEKIPSDIRIITALLHDVCKIGIYIKVLPKETFSVHRGESWEDKMIYERDDKFPIGHGEKSVILIQKFIDLTAQEMIMIRWHMGMYDESYNRNSRDITKYFPEAKLLYFADDISTQYLESVI